MKLSTQLKVISALSIASILVVGASLAFSTHVVNSASEKIAIVNATVRDISSMRAVMFDYERGYTERAESQLDSIDRRLTELFSSVRFQTSSEQQLLEKIVNSYRKIRPLFTELQENNALLKHLEEEKQPALKEYSKVLSSQLTILSQSIVTHSFQLYELITRNLSTTRRVNSAVILSMIAVFTLLITGTSFVLHSKIKFSIPHLLNLAHQVKNGNLDYSIDIDERNELREVYMAFNQMTSQLKTVYKSLEQEIEVRKQAEEALRENEERLKTLFGAMTEMVVLHELVLNERGEAVNYRIRDCNTAFTSITGIEKEDAIGKLATEVYHCESAPYLEEYSHVALTGETYEYTSYSPETDEHFMVSVVSPQQRRFATIATDITVIKQIQDELSAKNKELENYLYIASHDLRSPLVNIQGFSQRLQKQADSIRQLFSGVSLQSDIRQNFERITSVDIPKSLDFIFVNVARMDTLIKGLLKISRTGRMGMTVQKIDMNALVDKIVSAFSFQLEEAGAEVSVENLPECYGDSALLNQLFSNMISNALKYRDAERPLEIEVSARPHYNKVVYSIQDTGIGISPKHLEKIWDVFYQVDFQSSKGGEGIGLSIVKRIVDKHKGKVWVNSEEGKGSAFSVELPGYEFS